jgi:hypothetical protein
MRAPTLTLIIIIATTSNTVDAEPTIQRALAKIGEDIATKHCGSEARKSIQRVQNQFDKKLLDERVTIHCKNLVFVKYRAMGRTPPHEMFESLQLTGPHALLPPAISIGALVKDVHAFGGVPLESTPEKLVYLLNDAGPDDQTATFLFKSNRVSSITWVWGIN